MQIIDLVRPLERWRNEALHIKEIEDVHYLFIDFVKIFKAYVAFKDYESFSLLSSNEIACIARFSENDPFLSDSLMILLDIMEAVRLDYLEGDQKDKEQIEALVEDSIKEINRITFFDENDPTPDDFRN